jgi:hypothetical protein
MNERGGWRCGLVDGRSTVEREAVVRLRREAYATAGEFAWHDLATLGWTATDERSAVLGLWRCGDAGAGETLVSTVRATVFQRLGEAEAFLEHALDGVGAQAPALVLSRAATAPGEHGRGLLALLRVAYLQALPLATVRSVLAVVYDSAPRVRSMQAAGYTMSAPTHSWDSEARALTAPLVAHLPLQRFASALDIALNLAASAPAAAIASAQAQADAIAAALKGSGLPADPAAVQPSAGASSLRASSCAMLSRAAQSST